MKQLIIKLAIKWIPEIIEYLAKKAGKPGKIGKYGDTAKQISELIIEIEKAAKDNIIDEKEMKSIMSKSATSGIAIYSLFGKAEITLKAGKFK